MRERGGCDRTESSRSERIDDRQRTARRLKRAFMPIAAPAASTISSGIRIASDIR
jgi:hypothetical protein